MANYSEAYDFALFEERSSAAPRVVEQPRPEPRQKPRENVVELPREKTEKQAQRQPRPQVHVFRVLVTVLCFGLIFGTVLLVVYSQVQLTELTQEINNVTTQLSQAESVEIQLNMQAALRMNDAQIEEYVTGELGMSKITGTQVTYINVARADEGKVLQDLDGGSLLDRIWASLQRLLS